MLDDTTGSTRFAALDRRTLLRAGAWAAPVLVVAAAVPAASASPVDPGLNANGNVFAWELDVSPNAYAMGGSFNEKSYVQLIIGSNTGVLNPTATPPAGWVFVSASSTAIVAQFSTAVNSLNFNTSPFRHAYVTEAPLRSVTVSGRITGTTVTDFVGGPLVGPQ